MAEDCEAQEKPSGQDSLQSPETDTREIDRRLVHTSIPADSQTTSDEGASASFISGSQNIPPEEGVGILSQEQPSPEVVPSHNLVNTSENQDGSVTDINSSAEERKGTSDDLDAETENTHSSSHVPPGNHVNGKDTGKKRRISTVVIHLVSEAGNKKTVTENDSAQSSEATSPQSDTGNVVPRGEDDTFLGQEQSSQEDNQNQAKSPESRRVSTTFPDGRSPSFDAHLEAAKDKYRHNINTGENKNTGTENRISPQSVPLSDGENEATSDLVQALENESSRFDSDEDASSDFLPWSTDYPEKEEEMLSQGCSTPNDSVFDNPIGSPKNKQVSTQNSSDAAKPSSSPSGAEGETGLNKGGDTKKLKVNTEESEGKEGKASPDPKTTRRQQRGTSGRKMGYSLPSAVEFPISSSYDLPWYKYLLGRERREALRQACYYLLENLKEPLEIRMYNYIVRVKN